MSQASEVKVRGLNCPDCGAPLTIRGFAYTLNIVCESCLSVLDAKDPNFKVLQTAQVKERIQPRIPLGTRGILRDGLFEAIGFQERTITVEGVAYSWYEYLLFNPYKGFRYLTEYRGHWNFVSTVHAVPEERGRGKPTATYGGIRFAHFQTAAADTTYVIGEFPWQVRVGDKAKASDFVKPPRMLSKEETEGEVTWSLSEYMTGREVWQAFQLPADPPRAEGVFANQPSPLKGKVASAWKAAGWVFIAWLALLLGVMVADRKDQVFDRSYRFSQRTPGEHSFVTEMFELKGRPSAVKVGIDTDLSNNWAYFHFALINADTGEAYDFGREVSYYFGRDSDGDWTEGGKNDSAIVPAVPAGRYYLRVEPEMDENASAVDYRVTVTRDVPVFAFFWIALPLLVIPPVITSLRAVGFEKARWQESDHPWKSED